MEESHSQVLDPSDIVVDQSYVARIVDGTEESVNFAKEGAVVEILRPWRI